MSKEFGSEIPEAKRGEEKKEEEKSMEEMLSYIRENAHSIEGFYLQINRKKEYKEMFRKSKYEFFNELILTLGIDSNEDLTFDQATEYLKDFKLLVEKRIQNIMQEGESDRSNVKYLYENIHKLKDKMSSILYNHSDFDD